MPICISCNYFDKNTSNCSLKCDKGGRSLTRNCVYAIFKEEKPFCIGEVLEVGGGQWNVPRKTLRAKPDCTYHGVDPRWGDIPALNGHKGTVGSMPFFEDNFFTRVLAFETMEHWAEGKETIERGLKEIHRVLKPDCEVCITVPIHLHGTKEFRDGDIDKIKGYFNTGLWKNIRLEEWRKDYEPLPPSQRWYGTLEYYRKYSSQKVPSSWCLRINATKAIKT